MSLAPQVAQTYPLDSHLATRNRLLPAQSPEYVLDGQNYPPNLQRTFETLLPYISDDVKKDLH